MTLSLAEVEQLAWLTLERHRLTERGWRFAWDRAVRRAGACHYERRTVTLSRPIFSIEANRHDVHDTLLHEVAHALAGPDAAHGPEWRRLARSIGARPERCHALATPPLPLLGTCACGTDHQRTRRPKGRYVCRQCGGTIRWHRREAA